VIATNGGSAALFAYLVCAVLVAWPLFHLRANLRSIHLEMQRRRMASGSSSLERAWFCPIHVALHYSDVYASGHRIYSPIHQGFLYRAFALLRRSSW